jgi:hypothetical protein
MTNLLEQQKYYRNTVIPEALRNQRLSPELEARIEREWGRGI